MTPNNPTPQDSNLPSNKRLLLFGILFWSVCATLSLVFIAGPEHQAYTVMPIYGLAMLFAAFTLPFHNHQKTVKALFIPVFLMSSSTITADYLYIITTINPHNLTLPLFTHLWRLAAMYLLGAVFSGLFAGLAYRLRKTRRANATKPKDQTNPHW